MGKRQPSAPDPAKTAAAQGGWNSFTAQQQQAMNMVGQNSPWGSLSYEQTGSTWITDPNGKPIEVPNFTANTTLSPQQQAIFDQTQAAELNLANIANDQTGKLGELLSNPFEYTNRDAENWAFDLGSQRILPQQEQSRKALENQLVNSGIRRGAPAWDTEMTRLTNANTDQMNQLALTGRGQGFNEALAMRNQQLNEPIALASGTQIQNPNATFAQTPQAGVAGVDYTGLVNQKYQSEMNAYNSKMGALGGLFGAIAMRSDRRLKTDIKRIGATDEGTPIYSYRYKSGGPVMFGVMAQDLLETQPETVITGPDGFYSVRYDMVK